MKIKNRLFASFLLLISAGIAAAETYASDSAIINRNYSENRNDSIQYVNIYGQPAQSALQVKSAPAEISKLERQTALDPDNYYLYALAAGEYIKRAHYEPALDKFIILLKLKHQGLLDKYTITEINKIYSWHKRSGRRNSGLFLNLALMSSIMEDSETINYLSAGLSGAKNSSAANKALDAVLNTMNVSDALNACFKLLERNPDNILTHQRKAEYHAELNQLKEAEIEYEQVIKLNPADDASRYNLYKLIAASNAYDDKYMLKKLYGMQENFNLEKSYAALTELLIQHKNYDAANNYAAALMKKYPKNPNGWILTAEIYRCEGRLNEAFNILQQARNKADTPETAEKYNALLAKLSEEPVKEASKLIENGLFSQAAEVLKSADSNVPEVILLQAKAAYLSGNTQETFEHLNRAMQLSADNSDVYCAFASVYYQEKDIETARKYASKAVELNRDNQTAAQLLDLINSADAGRYTISILDAIESQNYKEAERLIDKAIEIDNKSADLYYYKSLVFIAQNDYNNSAEALKKCIEFDNGYIDAYFYLAASYDNLGNNDAALTNYQNFLSMTAGNELGRTERIEHARMRIEKLKQQT